MTNKSKSTKTILITLIFLYIGVVHGQYTTSAYSSTISDVEVSQNEPSYTMRLDFLTESQKEEVIQARSVGLNKLCDQTMGCNTRKNIILNSGDKIQLFEDDRVQRVELIEYRDEKKVSIAISDIEVNQNSIVIPKVIGRENVNSFALLFIQ